MPLASGQTFAGYTIIRLLGSGGMGEVYLAQHPRLPRRDALKLLPHDWSGDSEYRARFNREADLASTLWHPHIVGVHDRGEEDGQLWISMDFVDGLDGARLLADRYPAGMPIEEVARIVTAVASALDYAHKQGLLHRDVKPANIMMTHLDDDAEQRILLTDFGIARNVNDISGLTATNMTVGTVAYCAPEQLLGEDIDGRADQYSLAATTFQLLTGSHLFPHSNPAVVISRHLNVPPPAVADSRPDLAKLDPVIAIGLAKRPEDRFERCSEFARALGEQINSDGAPTFLAPTAPALRAVSPADAVPPRDERVDRNRWKLWVAALVVVAALGGAGIYFGTKKSNNTGATSTTTTMPIPTSTTTTPIPTSTTTTNPIPTSTTTASPLAAADVPGLAPFVAHWTAHEQTLVIRQSGSGHWAYADVRACPSCALANAPTGTVDFTLESVSNDVATGSVDASSDENNVAVGAPVTAQLVAVSPSGRVLQVSMGRMQQVFCNKVSVVECGA
jgi:serine/threonine protein kinase, bacterial